VIAVEQLVFTYRSGGPPVINGLDRAFSPGVITAVTGPSGCGKSTLLYLLGLMLTPTSGQIRWDGEIVSSLSDGERSLFRGAQVGFVFQDAVLDPSRTILDNVTEGGLYAGMPRQARRQEALSLLAHFGVEQRIDHRPGEVSGGQAQRVALCRALLKRPRLILADEPSGNLDGVSANIVWEALFVAADSGATVVVATHDLRRAAAAAEVLELRAPT
jgi:lipoprotein-releasing system ATP-binding protein